MEPISLKNHQKKCRVCFKSLNKRQKHAEITEEIEKLFFTITQINLIGSSNYSSKVCVNCDKQLTDFVSFKSNIIYWQTKLYENYPDEIFIKPEPKTDFLQINIKQENDEEDDTAFDKPGFDTNVGFNENLELLRDNMEALQEPADESSNEISKKGRGGSRFRGGLARKQRRVCPDCGK